MEVEELKEALYEGMAIVETALIDGDYRWALDVLRRVEECVREAELEGIRLADETLDSISSMRRAAYAAAIRENLRDARKALEEGNPLKVELAIKRAEEYACEAVSKGVDPSVIVEIAFSVGLGRKIELEIE